MAVLMNVFRCFWRLCWCPLAPSYIYIYIYIYAFSRRFYPKRLTIAFKLYIFHWYVCSLGIGPTTFCASDAMLYHWATQEHTYQSWAYFQVGDVDLGGWKFGRVLGAHRAIKNCEGRGRGKWGSRNPLGKRDGGRVEPVIESQICWRTDWSH